MSTWLINGASPESLGLTVVGGEFRQGSASSVRLARNVAFDAAESFAHGTDVTITRDGSPYFKGKVRAIPKTASGATEGHDYLVEDVWAELERLTYQEPWLIRQPGFAGTAYMPLVVLGMNSSGDRINVGQQIGEVLAFAESQGLDLQAGSLPTGMLLWPSEANGMSCAAVIRDCLKYYLDWLPWIDHTTTPPTFNVTPRASASAVSLAVTDCSSFQVTKTQDRVPDGVRIVYMTATMIDDEVYRTLRVDQYPSVSEAALALPAGPGILVTTVELQGMKMQIQKQQVQTRDLPVDQSTAKAYLKLKFPQVKDLADGDWDVTEWTTAVIPEEDDEVNPIDPKLERKLGADRTDLPRELVKGSVAEWMQKKVGRVLVEFAVEPSGSATDEEKKKIESLPAKFTVVCTNAVTKIYKGVSSYTAGEDAPSGIAQAFYTTLVNGCYFEGSVTLEEAEIGSTRWHGSKLNLTGGVSEWATMGAPIHAVSWDLESCRTTISFGPNPDYSVQDFLEFLRLLNKRPNVEYTVAERTGDTLGDEDGISARGDSIGPFDVPETTFSGGGAAASPVAFEVSISDGEATVKPGYVVALDRKSGATEVIKYFMPDGLDAVPAPAYAVGAGDAIFAVVETDNTGFPTTVTIEVAASSTASVHYQPPPDEPDAVSESGTYYYKIAEIEADGDNLVAVQFQHGGPIVHQAELWEGENLVGDGDDPGVAVYKQIDPTTGKFQFRKIKNVGTDAVDAVRTIKAPADPITDQVELKCFSPRDSDAQIRVTDEDDHIVIQGNDADGTITLDDGVPEVWVAWKDGLIETTGDKTFTVGNMNLKIKQYAEDTNGTMTYLGTSFDQTLYFRKGFFVGDADPGGEPEGLIDTDVANITFIS